MFFPNFIDLKDEETDVTYFTLDYQDIRRAFRNADKQLLDLLDPNAKYEIGYAVSKNSYGNCDMAVLCGISGVEQHFHTCIYHENNGREWAIRDYIVEPNRDIFDSDKMYVHLPASASFDDVKNKWNQMYIDHCLAEEFRCMFFRNHKIYPAYNAAYPHDLHPYLHPGYKGQYDYYAIDSHYVVPSEVYETLRSVHDEILTEAAHHIDKNYVRKHHKHSGDAYQGTYIRDVSDSEIARYLFGGYKRFMKQGSRHFDGVVYSYGAYGIEIHNPDCITSCESVLNVDKPHYSVESQYVAQDAWSDHEDGMFVVTTRKKTGGKLGGRGKISDDKHFIEVSASEESMKNGIILSANDDSKDRAISKVFDKMTDEELCFLGLHRTNDNKYVLRYDNYFDSVRKLSSFGGDIVRYEGSDGRGYFEYEDSNIRVYLRDEYMKSHNITLRKADDSRSKTVHDLLESNGVKESDLDIGPSM